MVESFCRRERMQEVWEKVVSLGGLSGWRRMSPSCHPCSDIERLVRMKYWRKKIKAKDLISPLGYKRVTRR